MFVGLWFVYFTGSADFGWCYFLTCVEGFWGCSTGFSMGFVCVCKGNWCVLWLLVCDLA